MQITLNSYAKINKNLTVGEKKGDYHLIESDIALIDLHSELTFDITKLDAFQNEISISVNGEKVDYKPIKKAINLWSKERRYAVKVALNIEDPLPLEAGLGAMSSYAATTIVALEVAYKDEYQDDAEPLSMYKKLSIAKSIGMDTMFFTSGLTSAHLSGTGDIITPQKGTSSKVILHFPDYKCSTKDSYEELDEEKVHTFIELKQNKLYYQKLIEKTRTDEWKLSGSGSTFFIEKPSKEILSRMQEWDASGIHCLITKTLK